MRQVENQANAVRRTPPVKESADIITDQDMRQKQNKNGPITITGQNEVTKVTKVTKGLSATRDVIVDMADEAVVEEVAAEDTAMVMTLDMKVVVTAMNSLMWKAKRQKNQDHH